MSAAAENDKTIGLAEETLHIDKRQIVTGHMAVKTVVDEVQEIGHTSLNRDVVEITRVPIGREISAAPEIRIENGVTIISVVEEIVVVEKRLRLVEEIHVHRRTETETVDIPVTLRKQRAVIESVDNSDNRYIEGQ